MDVEANTSITDRAERGDPSSSVAMCLAFDGLPDAAIAALDAGSSRLVFGAGEIVLSADKPDLHDVFVILEGSVDVFREPAAGARILLGVLGTGELFGELAAVTGRPGSASVQAREITIVAKIPREAFLAVLNEHAVAACAILARIARRLRILNERILTSEHLFQTVGQDLRQMFLRTL